MASQGQLIDDLIYDVFRQFIAIDVNGPFTLIQLNTKWRDAILANPRMWTWIAIDYSLPDIDQRIYIASFLSAELPLQITIKIPSLRLSELRGLLNRCRFLFIDRPELQMYKEIQTSEEEISQILLKSPPPILKRVYWIVEGFITSSYSKPLQDFLMRDNAVHLRALFEAFPTKMISHVHLEENHIYQPRQDTVELPTMDAQLPWDALAHLSHLTSLKISTSKDWSSGRRSIGNLTLSQLRNLTFEFFTQKKENLSVLDILSNIRAPNIDAVYLLGDATNGVIFEAISTMSRSMQPIRLELYIGNAFSSHKYNWAHDSAPQRPYLLKCLDHLAVTVRGNYDDTVIFLIMAQINRMAVAAPRLQFLSLDFQEHGMAFLSLLDPVSCLMAISLRWENYNYARIKDDDDDSDMDVIYPVNSTWQGSIHSDISELHGEGGISLTGSKHQYDITLPHSMKVTQERAVAQGEIIRSRKFRISRLTLYLCAEDLDVCSGALGIDAIEVGTLIIRRTEIDSILSPRTGLPDLWTQSLRELDIQDVTFRYPLYAPLDSESYPALGTHLPSLTTLRCPISVVVHLLKGQFVPQLRNLTLSVVHVAWDEEEMEWDEEALAWDEEELAWEEEERTQKEEEVAQEKEGKAWKDLAAVLTTIDSARRPQLITLGLEFYPDWGSLLQVIELYLKGEMNQRTGLRYLKLPGLPHPSILEQLVDALRGNRTADGSKALRPEDLSSSSDQVNTPLTCDYCSRSGWACYEGTEGRFCRRHTPEKLVTITMDTL